jgi:hypothetical protein
VDLAESYSPVPKSGGTPFDYFHINSVDVDSDGNLLVSARNTWTVYKIDHGSGEVIWRLGGKKSTFTMGAGTNFEWQHDARRQSDGSITLFDDAGSPQQEPQSRGLLLQVDEGARTASLVREYTDNGLATTSQGNMQVLPNGNVFTAGEHCPTTATTPMTSSSRTRSCRAGGSIPAPTGVRIPVPAFARTRRYWAI